MNLPKVKPQDGQMTDAQTQRLAALGFMLASVCHELSNPLAAIHSMLQILQSKRGVTPETMEKGLASLSQNVARVLAITRKLGDFSRVGADEPQPVAVDAAMEAAVWLVHHSEQAPRVTIDYRGAPGAHVTARAGQLEQIFFNVLLNAAQAGSSRIEVEAGVAGPKCIVAVADDGPGIAAGHLERIFDPFFTTKSPGAGTGLGLAICYEIVHAMGGAIRASNRAGGGARFEIELPA
jgi:C4-dicarboxylate-specific signal transduction histidine kinase